MAVKYKERKGGIEKDITKKQFDDACKDCNFNNKTTHPIKDINGNIVMKALQYRKLIYGKDGKIIGMASGWK